MQIKGFVYLLEIGILSGIGSRLARLRDHYEGSMYVK